MSNVPDDWNQYYHKCHFCKQTYHDSWSTECACKVCRYCSCSAPPKDMVLEDTCQVCADSGVWAWHDTDWDQQLFDLQSVFDSGQYNEQDSTEVLQKIELLQSTLQEVHKRLTKGITAQ
jgi:hypothetical protein